MTHWIIRCPNCLNAFHATEEEVNNPTGQFRCGSCYRVSPVQGNLYEFKRPNDPEPAPAPAPVVQAPPMVMAAPEPAPVAEPQAAPESSDRPALSPEQQAALEKMKELARRMQSFDTMKEPTLAPVTPEPLENSEPTSLVTINDASQDATDGLSLVESEVPPEMPAPVTAVVPESDEHPIQELQRVEKPKTSKFWLFAGILLCLAVAVQGVCLMNDRVLNKFPQTEPVFEKACKVFSCKVMPKKPSPFKVADATFERVRDHQYAIRFTLINPSSDPLPAPDLLLMINGAQGDLIAKRTIVPSYYMPEGVTEFQAGEQIRSGFAVTLSESTAPETIRLSVQ